MTTVRRLPQWPAELANCRAIGGRRGTRRLTDVRAVWGSLLIGPLEGMTAAKCHRLTIYC